MLQREHVRRLAHPLGVATTKDLASLELKLEALTQELTTLKADLKKPLNDAFL
jgi:polyhydroxyalkanoate synthesis regulator phasin